MDTYEANVESLTTKHEDLAILSDIQPYYLKQDLDSMATLTHDFINLYKYEQQNHMSVT